MGDRIPVSRFVGGSERLIAQQANNERTINLFSETSKAGGKTQRYLRPAEGITPFASISGGVVNTGEMFYQDGRLFACCGTKFVEIGVDGVVTDRGTIAYHPDDKPTMCSNGLTAPSSAEPGHQVMIVSNGHVYIFDTASAAFSEVDFGGRVISTCEYMDGYFLASKLNSRIVYYSALTNGLSWDFTLGFLTRSWGSDAISFIKRAGRQLWIVGTKTTEIWADTGNANTPFAPIQGAFIDRGCVARFTGQRDGDTLTWMSLDERGGGEIIRAAGYSPQAISTYSIARAIQQSGNEQILNHSEAFVHQIDGHLFYWLYVIHLDTTLVLDFVEQEWAERAMWLLETAEWVPHYARCHAYAYEFHLVGARNSGVIYRLSTDYLEDTLA